MAAVALGVSVRAVVAVHGAAVPGGLLQLGGVTVLPARMLRRYLRGLLPVMDEDRVRQLAERAATVLPPHQG